MEVGSSCWDGKVIGDWSNYSGWLLLDTVSSERGVDIGAESFVVEHDFGVIGLVFQGKSIKLLSAQVEVEHGEDRLELVLGDLTLSKLVEVEEELFDSDSLHDDHRLESELDVKRVVGDLDSLLLESVVDDIESSGWLGVVA